LSAVRDCLCNIFAGILHTGDRSSSLLLLTTCENVDGVQDHEIHLEYLFVLQIRISDAELRLAVFVTGNERVAEWQRIRLWLKSDWCSLSIYTIACKRG
jgi:hypothetical protein